MRDAEVQRGPRLALSDVRFDPKYLQKKFMFKTFLNGAMAAALNNDCADVEASTSRTSTGALRPFNWGHEQFADGIVRPRVDVTAHYSMLRVRTAQGSKQREP